MLSCRGLASYVLLNFNSCKWALFNGVSQFPFNLFMLTSFVVGRASDIRPILNTHCSILLRNSIYVNYTFRAEILASVADVQDLSAISVKYNIYCICILPLWCCMSPCSTIVYSRVRGQDLGNKGKTITKYSNFSDGNKGKVLSTENTSWIRIYSKVEFSYK